MTAAEKHPLRRRILQTLDAEADDWHAASELAVALGEELPRVSYHLRVLADEDRVEVAGDPSGASAAPVYRAAGARPETGT